jgi:hypothetical protein
MESQLERGGDEWLKRVPFKEEELEIRQIFEMEDLAPVLTEVAKSESNFIQERILSSRYRSDQSLIP